MEESILMQKKINDLKNLSPSEQLNREDEQKLLDVCEQFNESWKHSGIYRRIFEDEKKFLTNACSCIDSDNVLPQFLNKDCRNRGLKPQNMHANNLVICNSNNNVQNSDNVIESGNNMIACNFTNSNISPEAFIYAAKESSFYLAPSWLFMIMISIFTVVIVMIISPEARNTIIQAKDFILNMLKSSSLNSARI